MPFSTGCHTPLSNFEAGQNYKDVTDPAGEWALYSRGLCDLYTKNKIVNIGSHLHFGKFMNSIIMVIHSCLNLYAKVILYICYRVLKSIHFDMIYFVCILH